MAQAAQIRYSTDNRYQGDWSRNRATIAPALSRREWSAPETSYTGATPKILLQIVRAAEPLPINQAKFNRLVNEWQAGAAVHSSAVNIAIHPAYQQMIGMGNLALPFIFDRLKSEQDEPGHWFWALAAITTENPVPRESRGRITEMARAWLAWGKEKGYVQLD